MIMNAPLASNCANQHVASPAIAKERRPERVDESFVPKGLEKSYGIQRRAKGLSSAQADSRVLSQNSGDPRNNHVFSSTCA